LKKIFFQILLYTTLSLCQHGGEPIIINGDSLVGKQVNGENIREVIGNVVLTQGNVRITCNKATQYLAKNDALLEGNVVATQDTLTIKTERGFYYGDERITESKSEVVLNDRKMTLTALSGEYHFNERVAYFTRHVTLTDETSTLTSNKLTYFREEEKAIAVGYVTIRDSVNIIKADSLVHFRNQKITFAEKNVRIKNQKENTVIFGEHLEDYSKKNYSVMTESPVLVQVDTTDSGEIDTLVISSVKMESFNDSSKKFIATDSVRIIRGMFASKNTYSIFYRNEDKIITMKRKPEDNFPVLWYDLTQLTGDSVAILLNNNQLDKIEVFGNGFILSSNPDFQTRYDQMSGDMITIYFDTSGINNTEVTGNVLSIYYSYEGTEPNGLIKASSQKGRIFFEDDKVNEVKMYSNVLSEYHPENLVTGNELSFTLPSFILINDRPLKDDLIWNIIKKYKVLIND
jgi:lipopolysaccharide export system protein LptA